MELVPAFLRMDALMSCEHMDVQSDRGDDIAFGWVVSKQVERFCDFGKLFQELFIRCYKRHL